jgi:type I restriction enzyme S subunit
MSSSWPRIPLGEMLSKNEQWVALDPTTEYREVKVRLWGRGVVLRGLTPGSEIAAASRVQVRAGQFILSRIDARNGASGIVPPDLDGAVVSGDFPAFNINHDRMVPEFLGWFSKTKAFVDMCRHASEGTTNRVRLKEEQFLSQPIPLPPISEQRKTVAVLDALCDRAATCRELSHQNEASSGALVRSLLHRRIDTFAPACWRTLESVVRVRGGGTPSKAEPDFWEGPIPWISPKDMKRPRLTDAQDHISERAVLESSARLLPVGCVLIVIRGMILAHTVPTAVLDVPAAINQDMKALVPESGLDATYLSEVLRAMNPDLLRLVDRSTHDTRKLLTDKLMAVRIPVPSLEEQANFVEWTHSLQALFEEVTTLSRENARRLDALPLAVLSQLFAQGG